VAGLVGFVGSAAKRFARSANAHISKSRYGAPGTMLITPDDTIVVHGIHYMNNLGLFLFKDIISFGAAFYLISYYGRKAILAENQR
jgi:hypothetical protein